MYHATRQSRLLCACLPEDVVRCIYRMDPTFHRFAHQRVMEDVECSEEALASRRCMMRITPRGRLLDDIGNDLGLAAMLEFRGRFRDIIDRESAIHYFPEISRHLVSSCTSNWYLEEMLRCMATMTPDELNECSVSLFPWPYDVYFACGDHEATPASLAAYCGQAHICRDFQQKQENPQRALCAFLLARAGVVVVGEAPALQEAVEAYGRRRRTQFGG